MLPVIAVVLVISLGESVPKHRALRRHDSRRWAVRSARNLCSQRQQISHQRSIGGSRVGQAKGEAGLTSELLASPREVGESGGHLGSRGGGVGESSRYRRSRSSACDLAPSCQEREAGGARQPRGERGRREPPAAPPSSLRAPLARQNALEVPRPAVGFFRPHSGFRGYCLKVYFSGFRKAPTPPPGTGREPF